MADYPYSGEDFRKAREKANLTRAEMAAKSHTFVYEIINLEASKQVPPNKFIKIMAILGNYLPPVSAEKVPND